MNILSNFLESSIALKSDLLKDSDFLECWQQAADVLKEVVADGGTVYICGNGGSACDAMHFREELVGRYKREREGIRAQHLVDSSTMTCWSNDYDFSDIFSREVKTFVSAADALVLISTSGNSKNVVRAADVARERGAKTIGLLGKDGGALRELVDIGLVVPSDQTDRIQEVHITLIHAFCEFLEV